MRTTNYVLVGAAIALMASAVYAQQGTARPTSSPVKAVGTVRDVMLGMIQPVSTAVFGAASEPPQTADQWTALENAALTLAESGNLLLIGGRDKNEAAWTKWATEMRDKSEVFLRATRARDEAAIETANDEVYVTCEGCHKAYVAGSVN